MKAQLISKIIINLLFSIPYIFLIIYDKEPNSPHWPIIFIFIWGFIGFRWLLNAFFNRSRMTISTSLRNWGLVYVFGSLFVSIFGFFVIPVLIIKYLFQLIQLNKRHYM